MNDLLEKNGLIIYNECISLSNQICSNKTISQHPIKITGNGDIYVVTGIVPNPVSGILNTRFLNQTSISTNIKEAISKSKKIFLKKTEIKSIGNESGKKSKNGSGKTIFNTIKNLKQNINEKNKEKLKEIYIQTIIENTCKDILKKHLITPTKLPTSILQLYSKQIIQKLVPASNNYGFQDLNELIVFTILKIINF